MRSLARAIPVDVFGPVLLAIPPSVGYATGGMAALWWTGGITAGLLAVWSPWHARRTRRRTLARERIVITHHDGSRTELRPTTPLQERAR